MAINDIAAGVTVELNAPSRLDTKEIEGQNSLETFLFIEKMNNTKLNDDEKNLQNTKITESVNLCSERINNNQRSDEENNSRQDDENVKKTKYRNFLDSDSDEEDKDVISSLALENETRGNSESPDQNKTEKSEAIGVKRKSYRRLIDSESEVEDNIDLTKNDQSDDSRNVEEKNTRAKTAWTDSESEVENNVDLTKKNINDNDDSRNIEEKNTRAKTLRNKGLTMDSDSDDNIVDKKKNSNISDEEIDSNDIVKKKINALVDSESEDNDASKNVTPSSPLKKRKKIKSDRKKNRNEEKTEKKSKFSSLIDTDSESDKDTNEVQESPAENFNKSGHSIRKNEKSTKKRTGSQRASREEAMRQIHSETQRLIRTSEISLPYHRPKQRSLQDFLNRKNFIPSLPQGLTTAAKVKMSSELVGKVLEEKEREAELFYKSSDSEDETINCTPAYSKETREASNSESVAIEETQKLLKNDVQNAHNKKEIIKQGGVDLGVPRKLFATGSSELTENEIRDKDEDMEEEKNFDCEDPRKNVKETKHGLREVSIPRKLFTSDYDEGIESPSENYDVSTLTSKTTISESSQKIEGQSDSVDTGMDSLSQENESSISEIVSSKNCNAEEIEMNTTVKENFETSNISETPFISNKEIGRAKEKDRALRQSIESSENNKDLQIDPRNVFGNVIGLPPPEEMDEEIPKKNGKLDIKSKVLSTVSSVCPKLRGAPGMLIDLSDDVKPNKEGVQSLLDRFYRHSVVKTVEVNSSVTVLHTEKTADGLRIFEQILPYKSPKIDNFNDKELSKPGAKHLKLKSELIEKMAKKRGEEWKLKEQREKEEEKERENEDFEEEFDEEEDDEKIEEDEIQLSGESEPEENDLPERKNKKNNKSEFVDEEAEVSGEENDDVMEIDDEDEDEDEDKEENANGNENESSDAESESDTEIKTVKKCKKLNRIVKAFEDDSNSLPESVSQNENNCPTKTFERTKTDVDMFETEDRNGGWISDAESELPPSQILPRDQGDARSQLCKTPLTAVNVLRFVSPITQLTALNSAMDSPKDCSATKDNSISSQSIGILSTEKTSIEKKSPESIEKRNGFQKKLFQEPSGTVNDEELMDLCSGSFTGIGNENKDAQGFNSNNKLFGNSQTSQVMRFSSDSFFSQATDSQTDKNSKPEIDETSQDIRLTLDDDSQDVCNSEEIEKKSSVSQTKFKVVSSSDDEDKNSVEEKKKKKIFKKKKVKQLQLSDDEEEEEFSDEEENEGMDDNDTEDKYVDYDSEENEVVIVPKKDIKKVAANFLDAEAELSESDWDSADEDEKDLDKLEIEEGDDEEIDENKMRDQLGKIHMRQILDDDKRDVRMLQELLFDDGDLHTDGSGRERKFKWKNIDKLGEDGNVIQGTNDGDENAEQLEEENDLEWRKLRLEREKFIQEKMNTPTDEIDGELVQGSTIFKLGIQALSKKKSSQTVEKDTEEPITKKPIIPRTVMDLVGSPANDRNSKILHKAVKRGSFLARGDESLARLAVQIKNTETTIVTQQKPGNFVFAHISPSVAGTTGKSQKDETESEAASSVNAKARKRKPPAGTTPRTVKKAKVDSSQSTGKKLF